jgi:ATP-dependent DNA ligase
MVRVPPSPPRSGFVEPCLPSPADSPPSGPDWVHEIKHDGYRLMARRHGAGVRLLTRNGHDWADHYPLIAEAAGALQVRSFLLDREGRPARGMACRCSIGCATGASSVEFQSSKTRVAIS